MSFFPYPTIPVEVFFILGLFVRFSSIPVAFSSSAYVSADGDAVLYLDSVLDL